MSRYPNDIHPDYPVATVYSSSGDIVDYVGHQEAARSYAARGYLVVVHTGHDGFSREELQCTVDLERAGAPVLR